MRRILGWVLMALSLASIGLGTAIAISNGLDSASIAWVFVGPLPFLAAGAFLLWRRPDNPTSLRLVGLAAFSFALGVSLEAVTLVAYDNGGAQDWMWMPMALFELLSLIGVVIATKLVALLVSGVYEHPRERRFLRPLWLVLLLIPLLLMTNEFVYHHDIAFEGVEGVRSPFYVAQLAPLGDTAITLQEMSSLLFVGGIVLLLLRYRQSPDAVRRRLRWVLFGGAMAIAFGIWPFVFGALELAPALAHGGWATIFFLPILMLPVSIVIAVDEPTWLDMDILVSRSFVYGALSFLILMVYVAIAAALGMAAGRTFPIGVAIVVTVVVAVLFQPLRKKLQTIADRWVYGDRPSGYDVLTDFGNSIGEADDPSELLPLMADLIKRAVESAWVRVELEDGTVAIEGVVQGDPAVEVGMRYGADHYGTIGCGPKIDGRYSDEDLRLVHTLAAQSALAISNTRLAARIVTAQEAERRRIERNIHDGAQQELVALVAGLGMARNRLQQGELDPDALAALQREAMRILAELRELAQGIHPSVLTDGGLLEAVEDRCGRLPLDVTLEAPESLRAQRFGDDIEGAAYFFVTEGLANVLKHSDATAVSVRIQRTNGVLSMAVTDDGAGFDPAHVEENGLAGLRDRMTALGGALHVRSANGSGTTVAATLPVVSR